MELPYCRLCVALTLGGIFATAPQAHAQLETVAVEDAPASLLGLSEDGLGAVLLSADLDGDGLTDLLVGSPHTDTVWLLRNDGSTANWLNLGGAAKIQGDAGSGFGAALAVLPGESDGANVVAVGIAADGDAESSLTGQVALFELSGLSQGATQGLETAKAVLVGTVAGGRFGASLAYLPQDEGLASQLIIGAPGETVDDSGGRIYLLEATSPSELSLDEATLWSYEGSAAEAGAALAVGDFNGDGVGDVAIGAPATTNGRVFIVNGANRATEGALQELGSRVDGAVAGERFGASLAVTPPLSVLGSSTSGDNLLVGAPTSSAGGAVDLVRGDLAAVGQTLGNARLAGVHGGGVPMHLGGSVSWVGALVSTESAGMVVGAPTYPNTDQAAVGAAFFVPIEAAAGADRAAIFGEASILFEGDEADGATGRAVAGHIGASAELGLFIGSPSSPAAGLISHVAYFPASYFTDAPTDFDQDGYNSDEDCDDSDSTVNPGATEICDGLTGARVDTDCDGNVDEDTSHTAYLDSDGDGYGVEPGTDGSGCEPPSGSAAQAGDCDDGDATVNPDAIEICSTGDAVDEDCDGSVDEGLQSQVWYTDADSDGYGAPLTGVETCDPEDGAVLNGDDCDDNDANSYPEAPELCDGLDNDCDTTSDEGAAVDADQDTYTSCDGDCDDDDAAVFPGNTEICDLKDNDCNGAVDEGFDNDGDGYPAGVSCPAPVDCDDTNDLINPGAEEICSDSLDNNCDGETDPTSLCGDSPDADFDGYTVAQGDCDDTDPAIYPGGNERCDGKDNDCDGSLREDEVDADGDGSYTCQGTLPADCDDTDPDVYPNAPELCDGQGNGCVGSVQAETPTDEKDWDNDTYLACDGCADGLCDDCDDRSETTFPGAEEACDGEDDDCDGLVDEGLDNDGDGALAYACGGDDCDDTNPDIGPHAEEIISNTVDEDCDGVAADADGDGYCTNVDDAAGCASEADCDDTSASIYPGAPDPAGDGVDQACDGDPTPEPTPTPGAPTPTEQPATPTPYPPPVVGNPGLGGGNGVNAIAFACSTGPTRDGPSSGWQAMALLLGLIALRRRSE